jgi:hypothetical protein
MSAKLVNSIGLGADIIGAVLLWRFGLPRDVRRSGASYLLLEQTDEREVAKAKRYDALGTLGICLLAAGFALQLLSNLL